ncbi:precorrin-6y C5,15-methyltransferase (decarboxylating) subunit CbiE [Pseudonocardiaceae bacterium YIM PH 21723]|nr:precorrin-6y C5,15-methyltransferase (decarboxylating) subunit CbiE [Pseudonocardiaceae bacterium YIM PH 21723]
MTITVIGVDGERLPDGATTALAQARFVVGSGRALVRHSPNGKRTIQLGALIPALTELEHADKAGEHAVVLASGDPTMFGIVRSLRERGIRPVVLPSLSSVQRLLGRLGRPWDDVTVVSAHGLPLNQVLNVCRARRAVAVLTAPESGPAEIGLGLKGWRRTLVVAENLGSPEEQITQLDATEANNRIWMDPNIVLCLADPDAVPERGWNLGGPFTPRGDGFALAEEEFSHRDGMITKAEVRALALAKLGAAPGKLVWDIGAGSGSVGVECARLGAAVIAVERDPMQCTRVVANAAEHRVDVRMVEGEAPWVLTELPTPDSVFVGGGGPEVVAAAASRGAQRVVVTLAALERVGPSRDALRWAGYKVEGVQLQVARFADLPDGTTRLNALNPVVVLWGVRTPR